MSDTVWNVMVEVQQARRGRAQSTTVPPPGISKPDHATGHTSLAAPRRKRPTTLRSIRKLVVTDHYALLAEGGY